MFNEPNVEQPRVPWPAWGGVSPGVYGCQICCRYCLCRHWLLGERPHLSMTSWQMALLAAVQMCANASLGQSDFDT